MIMEKVAVVGHGTMGAGIAQAFLQGGFEVLVIGRDHDSLKRGFENISMSIEKGIAKGVIGHDKKEGLMENLKPSLDYNDIEGAVLVIEAVPESYQTKTMVLSMVEAHAEGAIIATNTSSIPVTKLSEKIRNKERFLGMHFFNPVPSMKLVEMVETEYTSDDTKARAVELVSRIGKKAVMVRDYPGFVANSILMPMLNEAAVLLEKKVAGKEDIDEIVRLGLHHPMGPLELADLIGIDVCVDIMEAIYAETKDEKFNPAAILKAMRRDGILGRKSGQGFYTYQS